MPIFANKSSVFFLMSRSATWNIAVQTCVIRMSIFYMRRERERRDGRCRYRSDRKRHLVNVRMSIKLAWEAIWAYTVTCQIAVCVERDVHARLIAFCVPMSAFSVQQQKHTSNKGVEDVHRIGTITCQASRKAHMYKCGDRERVQGQSEPLAG